MKHTTEPGGSPTPLSHAPPYFQLHIGLKVPCSDQLIPKEAVIAFLADRFESFTVSDAAGFYKGEPEPALVVGIAVADPSRVFNAAAELRAHFGWEGIGIVRVGAYERITSPT